MAADCFFHEGREAVCRCRQCNRLVCEECRRETVNGFFCSEACAELGTAFATKEREFAARRALAGRGNFGKWLKIAVFVIVLLLIIWLSRSC